MALVRNFSAILDNFFLLQLNARLDLRQSGSTLVWEGAVEEQSGRQCLPFRVWKLQQFNAE